MEHVTGGDSHRIVLHTETFAGRQAVELVNERLDHLANLASPIPIPQSIPHPPEPGLWFGCSSFCPGQASNQDGSQDGCENVLKSSKCDRPNEQGGNLFSKILGVLPIFVDLKQPMCYPEQSGEIAIICI